MATAVAARLRLSKKAGKRLATASGRPPQEEQDVARLAYRLGVEEAVDRILLGDGEPGRIELLRGWQKPRLLIGGGDLIALGLEPGPIVAQTLQALEREWAEGGFPDDRKVQQALARRQVERALRSGPSPG